MGPPRVAVVGGGIAGWMCAVGLRGQGAIPVVYDAGQRLSGGRLGGGYHPDSGAQFFRSSSGSRFEGVLAMLREHALVAPWTGRFGVAGARGGFLPATVLQSAGIVGSMAKDNPEEQGKFQSTGQDFCGFLMNKGGPLYVGVPSNASICSGIRDLLPDAQVRQGKRVTAVDRLQGQGEAGWRVTTADGVDDQVDAVVFASHDPLLAAAAVRALSTTQAEEAASAGGSSQSSAEGLSEGVSERLQGLAAALEGLRRECKAPAMTMAAFYAPGALDNVPFDAATVPDSGSVCFLSRDASKPGRPALVSSGEGDAGSELWTAVSTTALAEHVIGAAGADAAAAAQAAEDEMSREMTRLFSPFFPDGEPPQPVKVAGKRWGAAFTTGDLSAWSKNDLEDSITLEPFRMAIAGDFVRGGDRCPVEAAALSGLEAGERVGALLRASEE